jgi:DNA-binding MarR family transcriptional regulator
MRDVRIRDNVPNLVGKLFRQVARVHGRAVRSFEVSAVQANILALLWLEGAMTAGVLQEALALGSSTLTGAIDRMEKSGLVERTAVAGDRRAVLLTPANWPRARKDGLVAALLETEARCFAGLTAAERRELARLLGKAIDSIAEVDDGRD